MPHAKFCIVDQLKTVAVHKELRNSWTFAVIRSTPLSQPNKVALRCPSSSTSIRPQNVSSILVKLHMQVKVYE